MLYITDNLGAFLYCRVVSKKKNAVNVVVVGGHDNKQIGRKLKVDTNLIKKVGHCDCIEMELICDQKL